MKINRRQKANDGSPEKSGICEFCGEPFVFYAFVRQMRFCGRGCYNKAHSDPEMRKARMAFFDQVRMAKQRKIDFFFTFDAWYKCWLDSGHWHERGRHKGCYVMARWGDIGPYAVGNVRIIKVEQNVAERKTTHGTEINTCKIDEGIVRKIRRLQGLKSRQFIASKFGISVSSVGRIQNRLMWSWLK